MTSGSGASIARDLPEARTMALATLINTTGHGMFLVTSVLYFTRIVGFSPQQVGVGLTIAGLFGILGGVPLGHLSDRVGARDLLIWLLIGTGLAAAAVPFLQAWPLWVVGMSVMTLLDRGTAAVRSALIATSITGTDRLRLRAYLRSVNSIGVSAGAALGGIALAVDTASAYVAVLLLNAVTCWLTAVVLRGYPAVGVTSGDAAVGLGRVFRDPAYVVVTVLLSVMGMHVTILDVGLPLWISDRTTAPHWIVAAALVFNTASIVLLQVWVARRVESVRAASRAFALTGVLLLTSCLVMASTDGPDVLAAVALIGVALVFQTVAEMIGAAAQFCLGQDLAPTEAQGQYQGMASTGYSLSMMIGPTVITLLPITYGAAGWIALGVLFAVVGVLMAPVVAWAVRTRPQFGVVLPPSTGAHRL